MEAAHTTRDVRKNMQDNKKDWEKQRNGHPAGYGRAETICAGSRDRSSSGLATTVDLPTGGCHGLGWKHPVKVEDHLKTIGTGGRAPRGEKYSIRHAGECQWYIKQNSIICKCTL